MIFRKNSFQLATKITAGCFVFILAVFLFVPVIAHAQSNDAAANLDIVAQEAGMVKQDLRVIIGNIIKIFLSVIGIIAICIVLYAGFLYMTAGGDPEKVTKAKKWLINAVIGLAIIFSAYSITAFLLKMFSGQEMSPAGTVYQKAGFLGGGYGLSNGAFGDVIQSHYPAPEQTGVPRNTMILVTFKTPVLPSSVIDMDVNGLCPDMPDGSKLANCGALKADAFRVFKCSDMIAENYDNPAEITCLASDVKDINDDLKLVPGYAILTEDHQTIIFNPYGDSKKDHLGSPEEDMAYIVYLKNGIKKENNPAQTVFTSENPDYKWRFTTSTMLDLTPPKISAVLPADVSYPVSNPAGCKCSPKEIGCSKVDCDHKVYLNQGVYVYFNEPVIPPLTQTQGCKGGDEDNEAQIISLNGNIGDCSTNHLPGKWKVGINKYKTIQFISGTECAGGAKNSCGEPAFCLPTDATLVTKILAAKLVGEGVALPGTGIMDMGGNSLDGNANDKAEGPGNINADADDKVAQIDNYFWDFLTGKTLDLTPPFLENVLPDNKTENIEDLQILITANFNEDLDAYSVDTEVELLGKNSDESDFSRWYDPNMGEYLDAGGMIQPLATQISISHGPFAEYDEASPMIPIYAPVIKSEVKDTRMNCYSPTKDTGGVAESICSSIGGPGTSCCPQKGEFNLVGEDKTECSVPEH